MQGCCSPPAAGGALTALLPALHLRACSQGGRAGPPPMQGSGGGGGPSQLLPLDKVVSDIVAMGFSHSQVMSVVRQLQASGQGLEMNVIIDRLMSR